MKKEINLLLENHKNELRNYSYAEIEKALKSNGIQPTDELILFEKHYGGLKLIISNHEFQFGLLWGGGFPFNPDLAIVDFDEELSYTGEKAALYCSRNSCFENFTIDKEGRVLLGEIVLFDSFEELLSEYLKNDLPDKVSLYTKQSESKH